MKEIILALGISSSVPSFYSTPPMDGALLVNCPIAVQVDQKSAVFRENELISCLALKASMSKQEVMKKLDLQPLGYNSRRLGKYLERERCETLGTKEYCLASFSKKIIRNIVN